MIKTEIEKEFIEVFHTSPSAVYRAPGRVNLIGEHVDYNGGEVLPFAISLEIIGAISIRNDHRIVCFSKQISEQIEDTPKNLEEAQSRNHWTIYIHGVITCLKRHGYKVPEGMNLWFSSDLPVGAGLSSSAALEVLTIQLIFDVTKANLTKKEIALLAHESENVDIGVHCGIMDQFAVALCKKSHGLQLNTETQAYKHVEINLNNEAEFVLLDTRKRRALHTSEYNQRFKESRECLHLINQLLQTDFRSLADLSIDILSQVEGKLPKNLFQRARHVVSEVQRTAIFIQAISKCDFKQAGDQLTYSHLSLKLDYEVSCNELDDLVDYCLREHAYGARLTGAGFGGCVISLFPKYDLSGALERIQNEYRAKYGKRPYIYRVKPVDGSSKWGVQGNG